ncbi:MAG: hypothetical protein ABJC79_00585 [Acidimicrobiia bacterium]
MHVLVMESSPGVARVAISDLERAGHHVHRCHEVGDRPFPCRGLASGACPLEIAPIDVVVTVRDHPRVQPSPIEDGVVCALRRRVPVVVSGQPLMNPFESLGAVASDGDDVVAACENVARGPQVGHSTRAQAALDELLELHGFGTTQGDVSVCRADGRLEVRVRVDPAVPQPIRRMAAVRITGGLRTYDPYAAGIDVSCEERSGPSA